jgi:hypothetical protein
LTLLDLALAGRRRVQADDVFVAAVGEHLAVNSLGAADGFLGGGTGSGGAVNRAFESDADFVFVFGLLERGVEEDGDEAGGAQANDYADLGIAIRHGASWIAKNNLSLPLLDAMQKGCAVFGAAHFRPAWVIAAPPMAR